MTVTVFPVSYKRAGNC